MNYSKHPNIELVNLFKEKPYQGQHPEKAKVIVIGNDANYSPQISEHFFFKKIKEYHSDSVSFWKKYGKHHPFLLPDYPFNKTKDGVRYHLNFNKMQFNSEHAEYFSFVELLDIPTIGNTDKKIFFELMNVQHLKWLENIIWKDQKKFVLVNQTLAATIKKIEKKFGVFGELSNVLLGKSVPSVVLDNQRIKLFNGYSFSHTVTNDYLTSLSKMIKEFIQEN